MGIREINSKKIKVENEKCNSFVTMHKEIKEFTKLLKGKEVLEIQYIIEVKYI